MINNHKLISALKFDLVFCVNTNFYAGNKVDQRRLSYWKTDNQWKTI